MNLMPLRHFEHSLFVISSCICTGCFVNIFQVLRASVAANGGAVVSHIS